MAHPDLLAHRAQFEKSITRLGDGIYTAVGYAASNVHMIEGDSSITIIDTSESTKAAENILAEFQKLSDKPIARTSILIRIAIIFLAQRCLHKEGMCPFWPITGSNPILLLSPTMFPHQTWRWDAAHKRNLALG